MDSGASTSVNVSKKVRKNVLLQCKERKRLLKTALDRRREFSCAHCKYILSLHRVGKAISSFVDGLSASPSKYLLTNNPSTSDANDNVNPNPPQQTPPETPDTENEPSTSTSTSSSRKKRKKKGKKAGQEDKKPDDVAVEEEDGAEREGEEKGFEDHNVVCEHFHDVETVTPPEPSVQAEAQSSWDFFSPCEKAKTQTGLAYAGNYDDNLVSMMSQEEWIPDLEEEKATPSAQEGSTVKVMDDAPSNRKELLEALKDIVGFFLKAYESGFEVSNMLEANTVQLQTGFEGRKGRSRKKKIFRSFLSSGASCLSIFSSENSSTWTEFNSHLKYDTMEMGSLSETLCRLYAWERKLYDDVKNVTEDHEQEKRAGEDTKKIFDRKCKQLLNKNAKAHAFYAGKTRADVIALGVSNSVSIQRVKSTSERIVKIRDEELHPQLVELRQGLMTTWQNMLELHGKQMKTMVEVAELICPTYAKFCSKYHRLATVELDAALQNWRACFSNYVSSQKAYLEVLNGWISICIIPEIQEKNSGKKNNSLVITNPRAIPLVAVCQDWLATLNKLPNTAVKCAMKDFGKHFRKIYVQQGKEMEQRRKVDRLTKEYDRKVKALKKAEKKIYKKQRGLELDSDAQERLESLVGMKASLEMLKKMVDEERDKHICRMEETKSITLKELQEGFSSVFESMIGFSNASVGMYAAMVTSNEGGTNEYHNGNSS